MNFPEVCQTGDKLEEPQKTPKQQSSARHVVVRWSMSIGVDTEGLGKTKMQNTCGTRC